jgi:hypothetical protein
MRILALLPEISIFLQESGVSHGRAFNAKAAWRASRPLPSATGPRWLRQSPPSRIGQPVIRVGSRSPLPIVIWSAKTVAVVLVVAFVLLDIAACRPKTLRAPTWMDDGRLPRKAAAERELACGRHAVVARELSSLPPFRHHFRARVIVPLGHQYRVTYTCGAPVTCAPTNRRSSGVNCVAERTAPSALFPGCPHYPRRPGAGTQTSSAVSCTLIAQEPEISYRSTLATMVSAN